MALMTDRLATCGTFCVDFVTSVSADNGFVAQRGILSVPPPKMATEVGVIIGVRGGLFVDTNLGRFTASDKDMEFFRDTVTNVVNVG